MNGCTLGVGGQEAEATTGDPKRPLASAEEDGELMLLKTTTMRAGKTKPGRAGMGTPRTLWWRALPLFLEMAPKRFKSLHPSLRGALMQWCAQTPEVDSAWRKNDGSFKRWLLGVGFEASALFDRNKCMISVPHAKRTTRGTRGGRKNRGADRGTNSDGEQDGIFDPPYGLNSPEAFDLEEEVLSHLREHGDCDMGALRQVNDLGRRFNEVFFHKSKVNDGSWKKWLVSMSAVEVVCDPKVAAFHGNKPTVVRLK